MNIAERIMRLFQIKIPLNKTNVDHVLRKTVGEANYKAALRHLVQREHQLVLEQYDKDQLIEIILNDHNDVTIDELYDEYFRNDIDTIEDFVEYLDDALPENLRA